jgi:hypothetical protein
VSFRHNTLLFGIRSRFGNTLSIAFLEACDPFQSGCGGIELLI